MILIASMIVAAIVLNAGNSGLVYAFGFALSAEVLYLLFIYNLIKTSEKKLREKYGDVVETYKNRLKVVIRQKKELEESLGEYKKNQAEQSRKFSKIKKANETNEQLLKEQQILLDNRKKKIEKLRALVEKYERI